MLHRGPQWFTGNARLLTVNPGRSSISSENLHAFLCAPSCNPCISSQRSGNRHGSTPQGCNNPGKRAAPATPSAEEFAVRGRNRSGRRCAEQAERNREARDGGVSAKYLARSPARVSRARRDLRDVAFLRTDHDVPFDRNYSRQLQP